jgi:DNA polymerase III subunit gamma/tau
VSYQVLARKWRPRSFREMAGQEHVLKALINALDFKRLHHAYLFTGTRGVGKTTLARILARCLNCEVGVSSSPCGECSACREITEGRFIDLIEVDAASRTKVEDTRELLDNVQYAPTRGRYKIYLIDEVHMLSSHSFNALLKTLEEPPEHVKFLLATTDPQKLPVTILSRCLQFNLKNLSPERIVQHLQFVLQQEMIPFDDAALWLLARSADGSMRDALSLTDQAIAFGCGKLATADVAGMLGSIDHKIIAELMGALIEGDATALLHAIADFAEQSPDYYGALSELITLLHRIAIAQVIPDGLDNSYGDREQILQFARSLTPEDTQLFYQMGLLGRRDLPLALDPRGGFEMTLLRMLAFKPQGLVDLPKKSLAKAQPQNISSSRAAEIPSAPIPQPLGEDAPAKKSEPPLAAPKQISPSALEIKPPVTPSDNTSAPKNLQAVTPENWLELYRALNIRGVLQSTVANCVLTAREHNHFHFVLDQDGCGLYDDSHRQRFTALLQEHFGEPVQVSIQLQQLADGMETPLIAQEKQRAQRKAEAIQKLRDDPIVQALEQHFEANLDIESVKY